MVCLTFPKAENSWWSSASVVVEEIPPTKTLKSESENIAQKTVKVKISFLKKWKYGINPGSRGGDSPDNDYKVKVEMTQKVKVVQKMPPQRKRKGDEIVEKKISIRKRVLRQRKKRKENIITKFDMCTRRLPCYMSFIFVY